MRDDESAQRRASRLGSHVRLRNDQALRSPRRDSPRESAVVSESIPGVARMVIVPEITATSKTFRCIQHLHEEVLFSYLCPSHPPSCFLQQEDRAQHFTWKGRLFEPSQEALKSVRQQAALLTLTPLDHGQKKASRVVN